MSEAADPGQLPVPSWLRGHGELDEVALQAWDEAHSQAASQMETLSAAVITGDNDSAARAWHAMLSLSLPSIDWWVDEDGPLSEALAGRHDASYVLDEFETGAVDLTSDEADYVHDDPARLRLVAFARHFDVGRTGLNEVFMPRSGPHASVAVRMAARAGSDEAERLTTWLDEHPELFADADSPS